jgi:peptidoglycan/xylan/chitin deacetylase (PgdA/CDA1 family)
MLSPTPTLVYHKVGGPLELGVGRISAGTFRRQVELLTGLGARTIVASEVSTLPEPGSSAVALTFDDGYQSLLDSAVPVLTDLGMTATIFCLAGFLGRPNTWDTRQGRRQRHLSANQLRMLSGLGFEIACHGLSHRLLTSLSKEQLADELVRSKVILEDATGRAVRCFSYPFGRADSEVISAAEDAGYEKAFGLGRSAIPSKLLMPRSPIHLYDGIAGFRSKLVGCSGRGRNFFDRVVSRMSLGTAILQSLAGAANR